jgi:hypothetical protein
MEEGFVTDVIEGCEKYFSITGGKSLQIHSVYRSLPIRASFGLPAFACPGHVNIVIGQIR